MPDHVGSGGTRVNGEDREVPCLGLSQARSKKSRLFGAGFIWTKKPKITFLSFRLCLSRRCGSITRVNTRNGVNARALERL